MLDDDALAELLKMTKGMTREELNGVISRNVYLLINYLLVLDPALCNIEFQASGEVIGNWNIRIDQVNGRPQDQPLQ